VIERYKLQDKTILTICAIIIAAGVLASLLIPGFLNSVLDILHSMTTGCHGIGCHAGS